MKMKKIVFLFVISLALLLAGFVSAGNLKGPMQAERLIRGDEPILGVPVNPGPGGLITESPGEVVGETQYDYQSNGSTGNRIVLDSQGGKHVVWMKGIDYAGGLRSVYFNYADADDNWLVPAEGQVVSQANGAGYTQISITSDDRAGAAYHETALNNVTYAEDQVSGFGIFNYFDPPDRLSTLDLLWPYITIDRNDRIHIVSCESPPAGVTIHTLGYTMSADGGESWTRLQAVDTTATLSQNVVSSPVSDKVAIVYSHPIVMDPPVGAQLENNIYYIQSEDGETWDWTDGKVNVTDYGRTDSTRAYTDVAAVYDYNDVLHIIWNTQWVYVIDGAYYVSYLKFLNHYDTDSEVISEITRSDTAWVEAGCDTGAWNLNIAKMSLGVHEPTGAIFTVYTAFLDSLDCSAGGQYSGWANGELYMTYSVDGGASWVEPENLTNSPSPGCAPGDCDSDHWSSLANKVGDYLHILYINDKDAGGIPQDNPQEGEVTDNPVLYLAYPNPLTGIDGGHNVPTTFSLSQNYPNPFNARTSIGFELLEDSEVELSVYDITGAKVATLVDSKMEAGQHSVNWDANEVASGVYYYSLKANGEQSSKKMTLLK
jgi:hypothetical protein